MSTPVRPHPPRTITVTVQLPGGAADLTLAARVPVGCLLDRFISDGLLNEASLSAPDRWQLGTATGRALHEDRSLAAQGIRAGDHLVLGIAGDEAASVSTLGTGAPASFTDRMWNATAVQATALAVAVPFAAALTGLAGGNLSPSAALAVTAGMWLLGGVVVRRMRAVRVAPTVLLVTGGGLLGLTATRTLASPGPELLTAGVGCGVVAGCVFAVRLIGDIATVAAIGAIAVPIAAGAALGWVIGPRPPTELALLAAMVGLAELLCAARIGVRLDGQNSCTPAYAASAVGPRPLVDSTGARPQPVGDPVRPGPGPVGDPVGTSYRIARGITTGAVVIAVPAGLLVALDDAAGLAFAALLGMALLLRAASGGRWTIALPLAVGAVVLLGGVALIASVRPSTATVSVLMLIAASILVLTLRPGIAIGEATTARWCRRGERGALAALMPLAVAVGDGFEALADLVLG